MEYKWLLFLIVLAVGCSPKIGQPLPNRLKNRDVELITTKGTIRLRLYDDTPQHRDNFLKLARSHFYDGILFHRVIQDFMIQAGDQKSKNAGETTRLGNGGPSYTIPAEIRPNYFHHKGVLAAARTGDQVNPQRASSGSQFYIVQGRVFNDQSLDSVETHRLNGKKIPQSHRDIYKTIGGAPHLDQAYTIFGEVISGIPVIDSIAAVKTSGQSGGDRPLEPVKIIKARLIRRN
ncbi:peptidylprolyl isomerase [Flavihumibacter sp. UBA7668]|uniref:peptidylprolyl isomerase n=1 Tax=Flavihumibacter sp. UBA7668 TaxID=1946542 RepID=UPI0025C0D84C|nr:peptidylprolyl isomerase [Flavihumibacter sp. UBA7668]